MLAKVGLATGDKFVLPLRFDEGGGWLVLCEVRNCRRLASGHFKIGGHFIERIEDAAGNLWMAKSGGLSRYDRRHWQVVDTRRGWLTAYLNGRVLKRWPYKLLND